jgi:heat-inducible transcriptional repressor
VQERDSIFDDPLRRDEPRARSDIGAAEQPEFATTDQMRRLLALTESNEDLAELLRRRHSSPGVSITIGNEHGDPRFENFTIVTSAYRAGSLTGVIGVIGPTRMPYEKVIAVVTHASRLVSDLLD